MNNPKILTIAGAFTLLAVIGVYFASSSNKVEPSIDSVEAQQSASTAAKAPASPQAPSPAKAPIQQPTAKAPLTNEAVATKAEVKTPNTPPAPSAAPQAETAKFSALIDMNNWSYNAENHVYYQLGIPYCKTPDAEKYQKLALFVPEAYLTCQPQNKNKYSCATNDGARIAKYTSHTAPLVFITDSPQYNANSALTTYQDHSAYTDAGIIYVHIGFRGIEHGAPAAITDIKAAIRFLKHNAKKLPGNQDAIYTMGINEGAGLATILASSGNSKDFLPYLQTIGAIESADDNIKGVLLYNPPSPLEIANEEYEWNYGGLRQNLTPEQQKISDKMAREYANYINRAGFINRSALTLQYSDKGIHQAGSYYDYIKTVLTESLNEFFATHKFPYLIPKSWAISEEEALRDKNIKLSGTYQSRDKFVEDLNARRVWITYDANRKIEVRDIETFNKIFKKKFRPLASFDGFDRKQTGNLLFNINGKSGMHFDFLTATALKGTESAKEFNSDIYKQDTIGYTTLKRANMYNPFYYLLPSYGGFRTSTVAPYWNINSGVFQTNTPLTAGINLALATSNYPTTKNVTFHTVWGMGDISSIANSSQIQTLINWITQTYEK